jgi:hypothetical protein
MSFSEMSSGELRIPSLTKTSWPQFKESFEEYALRCGEAGEIIIRREDIDLAEPVRQATRTVRNREGAEAQVRIFPDNEQGEAAFTRAEKRYRDLKNEKKRLISVLLSKSDREVKNALQTSEGYAEALREYNLWLSK